jgi:hypothetical protein
MARKFRELEARMSSESIAASDSIHAHLKETMEPEELRDALGMTQQGTPGGSVGNKVGTPLRQIAADE